MPEGWLLDAKIGDFGIELTLLDPSGSIHLLEAPWLEEIYLTPEGDASIEELRSALASVDEVSRVSIERWRTPPWYRKRKRVLVAEAPPKTAEWIRRHLVDLGVVEAWNCFPSPEQRALWRLGITASALVSVEEGGSGLTAVPVEDPGLVEYEIPPFRAAKLSFLGWAGTPNRASWRVVERIRLECGDLILELPKGGLDEVGEALSELDPHILVFDGPQWIRLAEGRPELRPAIGSKGKVILEASSMLLGTGLAGLVEWSRLSRMPMRLASGAAIGQVLTSIEAFEAFRRRYLVPRIRFDVEGWKSPTEMLRADRGGLVTTPKPGVYWKAAQLDFNSLFPNIMAKNNVSPETVNDPGCRGRKVVVPDVEHEICLCRRGLVAEVVGRLVKRRERLRELAGRGPLEERKRYEMAQAALKWILVACFGYLGYKNARFGKLEAYECVTALAREVMDKATEAAEREGFEVLHAMVDSLFVWRRGASMKDFEGLEEVMEEETGYSMKIEALYKWVAFFPSVGGPGVPTRYLGRLVDGSIKAKGLDLVRRDCPPLVKRAQRRALEIIVEAEGENELLKAVSEALRAIEACKEDLYSGKVDRRELVVERRLSRDPKSYSRKISHAVAARALGMEREGPIRYIEAKTPYPVDLGPSSYSAESYAAWLERSARPFRQVLAMLSERADCDPRPRLKVPGGQTS